MSGAQISDIPTLARWTEVGVDENDNALNGHINTLQRDIAEMTYVEATLAPWGDEKPTKEYTAVNSCCRSMALLLSDLQDIRKEVMAAR